MPAASLPNLRHLRGFIAAARSGRIAAAASVIGLSQPALTQAIAGVEKWAGIQLFDRTADGLRLTEPGDILRHRVERGLRRLEQGVLMTGAPRLAGHKVTLAQIHALIAAVEQGGFRPAARKLGLQASSISRSCRDLQETLKVPLFGPARSGMRASHRAEELARLMRLALAEIVQARHDLNIWRGRMTGRLAVGSLPLAQASIIPRALARFVREFPMVECSVVDGYYASLARALRRADIDMIVGALRGADLPEDLVQTKLFLDPLAVVARGGHPLAEEEEVTLQDLDRFGWIAPRSGAPARAYFEQLVSRAEKDAVDRTAPVETGAHSVVRGLLRETDRVTLISLSQVQDEIEHGLLTALNITLPHSERSIGYTVREDWLPGLPHRRFLEILHTVVDESFRS